MSEKKIIQAAVCSQQQLAEGIFDLKLKAPEIAGQAKAGQFVSLYSADASRLLPRPISLCGFDADEGTIRLVYRVAGAGTREFSELTEGDVIRVMGPLGNGFTLRGKRAMIIGGGIGVPPMLELVRKMNAEEPEQEKTIVLGYRDAQTFLLDEFEAEGRVVIATEDGSLGTKGNVLGAFRALGLEADVIYACGPRPMLKALKNHALSNGIECYISMEERMACGIGACLACVCNTKNRNTHTNVSNARVCMDGPVFDAREVDLS